MPANAGDTGGRVNSKVARLIRTYDLGEQFGDKLEDRWTADGDQRESLRDLAARFNRRLLESALDDAGISSVDGEVENLYRLLTSDDVSSGNRTEARRRLEQDGVDIDQLERDFVTYQAIRSYLTEYRDAAYDRDGTDAGADTVVETIQRLKSRVRSVAENSIDRLQQSEQLSIGSYRLFVDISVLCEDCDTQYGLVELLNEGSCACRSEQDR